MADAVEMYVAAELGGVVGGAGGGRGRSAFTSRVLDAGNAAGCEAVDAPDSSQPGVQHVPAADELSADPEELASLRDILETCARKL
eukprot:6212425-Pleurochrysis_carterae.AAC.5